MALAGVERLGQDSPARLLAEDRFLLRSFCEAYLPRHPLAGRLLATPATATAVDVFKILDELQTELRTSEEASVRFFRAGGAQAICDLMSRTRPNADCQASFCHFLGNVAFERPEVKVELAEAIEVIFGAMAAHKDDVDLARACLYALSNVSVNVSASRARAVERGGLELCIDVLRRFGAEFSSEEGEEGQDGPRVFALEQALVCMGNIVSTTEDREKVTRLGGLGLIVGAVKRHPFEPKIQEYGAYAAANIGFNCVDNKAELGRQGMLELLILAIDNLPTEAGVTEECCHSIGILCNKTPANQLRAAENGAIVAVLDVMATHRDNARNLEEACYALTNILSSPTQRERFLTPEVESAVAEAAGLFPDEKFLQQAKAAISRTEHPAVARAHAENVCTLVHMPRCTNQCPAHENLYCEDCAVAQTLWTCVSCFGSRGPRLCDVCFRRHGHSSHTGASEVFLPGTCSCQRSDCKKPA